MRKPHPLKLLVRLVLQLASSLSLLAMGLTAAARSQTVVSLSEVKKIYVTPLGQGKLGSEFQQRVISRLRKDGSLEVVDSRQRADAVLSGDGQIWVTGHVSNNPRSPASSVHAIYSGFLSARVTDRGNQVMWSYLVTPRKFAWGGIVQDLSDNLTAKLLDARQEKREAEASVASRNSAPTPLHGAGATFPAPLYQKWFQSLGEQPPNQSVAYDGIGSEEGIRELVAGKLDFAASDMPLPDERMSQLGTRLLQFATVLGAVVPIYNVSGAGQPLQFSPEVLAGIYLGKITHWNDPKIQSANRGVSLPDSEIVVVHRVDGSGTTFVWSDFLSKVSLTWNSRVGRGSQLNWPVGIGEERNEGVASRVQQTPNSIGYVEMVFALQHELSFGAVRNAAGEWIRADLASVTRAAAGAAASMTSDFRVSITNPRGRGAYPIASFTWLLLPRNRDANRQAALREMLEWILTSGQKECSELGYAPLPREVVNRELQALRTQK
jgi:phosphate transport system substrate-binding protein